MNNKNIISSFNTKGFDVINYIYAKDCIIYYVSKDYAKKFNINFDGNIILEVKIRFEFFKFLTPDFYPTFKEISSIIPFRLPREKVLSIFILRLLSLPNLIFNASLISNERSLLSSFNLNFSLLKEKL